jgi:uncharacterized protein YegP (UPF0339 family)
MGSFGVYQDAGGEWRWRFMADNNEIVFMSSEGYTTKRNCLHSIKIVKEQSRNASVFDLSTKPPTTIPDNQLP